jgi:hypothetical protein
MKECGPETGVGNHRGTSQKTDRKGAIPSGRKEERSLPGWGAQATVRGERRCGIQRHRPRAHCI